MNIREEWHLDTQHLGRRVCIFDQVDSTNTQAATLAHDRANDGIVILADEQTAGRGQHGRSWHGERGAALLMSVLLFPEAALRRPVILAAWVANSVCETIRVVTGVQAKIKWPNDVLIRGRKVCGILIEQGLGTVVGIGLNVRQTREAFAAADLPLATSLAICTGRSIERDAVARELIRHLDEGYAQLCAGDLATLEACWKWRTGLLGKQVVVECVNGMHQGRLRELAWEGLDLEMPEGESIRLCPESVKHITAVKDL